MLFQLPEFLAFFVVFMTGLAIVPRGFVLPYVISSSLVFYAFWYWPYVFLLMGLVVLAWGGARIVHRRPSALWVVVLVALCPLVVFKYADFLLSNTEALTGLPLPRLGWLLPLGISFVTFTLISLIVDTAKRRLEAPPSLLQAATYITVFPHLIAGPILRAGQIFPQFAAVGVRKNAFGPSLTLFAVGMMKKVLIADPIGLYVDRVYAGASTAGSWEALLAVAGFSVQIYCDFSAYSDMAIALAAMMGIRFPENFAAPFAAKSVTEFWQRWHITLSTWLRDYVLMPLTKHTVLRWYGMSLLATMLVSGLWHGANWTFVAWGGLNGAIMVAERLTGFAKFSQASRGLWKALFVCLHFAVFSLVAILFRSPSMAVAGDLFMGLMGRNGAGVWPVDGGVVLSLCALALVPHAWDRVGLVQALGAGLPRMLAWPGLLLIVGSCAMLAAGRPTAFYYFDF